MSNPFAATSLTAIAKSAQFETLEDRLLLSVVPLVDNVKDFYRPTNLVADTSAGMTKFIDPNLVNGWGLAATPTGPFWVADNAKGVATVYSGTGQPQPAGAPLVVTIPTPTGTGTAAPTGLVANPGSAFKITANGKTAPATFLFATEDGAIAGWNGTVDSTHAILEVNHSAAGDVYKGLAIGKVGVHSFLYAADFHNAKIDVFNAALKSTTLAGRFSDTQIPAGYAPFNIANLNGKLYVTYAKQNPAKHDDVAGAGNGFIDVFSTNGVLLKRLVQHGALNSPWGMTMAPSNFGKFSNSLLVGNFGSGKIAAYSPSGVFRGYLQAEAGPAGETPIPLVENGLWSLQFGNGHAGTSTNTLYFTAGPNGEANGDFGQIVAEG